jgi:hypothetical protein
MSFGTAWTIHPEAHNVSRGQLQRGITPTNFGTVDKDLALLACNNRPRPRAKSFGRGQKLIQAHALLVITNDPFGF